MAILVDHREPPEMLKLLEDIGLKATKTTIAAGDYLITEGCQTEGIAVERKTYSNFLSSLFNNILFDQILRMKCHNKICVLIIEGPINTDFMLKPKIFYSAVQKIQLGFGICIILSSSIENTAEILRTLHNNAQNDPNKPLYHFWVSDAKIIKIEENPRVSPTINGGDSQLGFSANSREAFIPKLESGGFLPLEFKRKLQERVLMSFPGIGHKRAKKLLANFSTLNKIFGAEIKELASCDKIGTKVASKMKRCLEEKCYY